MPDLWLCGLREYSLLACGVTVFPLLSGPFFQFDQRDRQEGENGHHKPLHICQGRCLKYDLQRGKRDDGTLHRDT